MPFRLYLDLLRRRWAAVAVLTVIGAGLGVGLTLIQTPVYRASAELYVSLGGSITANEFVAGSTFARQQVRSYAGLVTAPIVLDPVIDELDLDTSARTLGGRITAQSPEGTSLIELVVSASTADEAAQVANAAAAQAALTLPGLEAPGPGASSDVRITVVREAVAPEAPAAPRPLVTVATGTAVGLLAGLVLAVLLETADRTVRGRDVASAAGLPLLAEVPRARRGDSRLPLSHRRGLDPGAEAIRGLRAALVERRGGDQGAMVVLVTSVGPGGGRPDVSLELAVACADAGARVLVVDTDVREAAVSALVGAAHGQGLAEVVTARVDWRTAVRPWARDAVHVLVAGARVQNPGLVVDSPVIDELLREWSGAYEVVILDVASALLAPDALTLGSKGVEAVVVVEAGLVDQPAVDQALERLAVASVPVVGLVLTGSSGRSRWAQDALGRPTAGRSAGRTGSRRSTGRDHLHARGGGSGARPSRGGE